MLTFFSNCFTVTIQLCTDICIPYPCQYIFLMIIDLPLDVVSSVFRGGMSFFPKKYYYRGLPFSKYAAWGRGSSSRYISITYYMQKGVCVCGGRGVVQIACKIAYVLHGRPRMFTSEYVAFFEPI